MTRNNILIGLSGLGVVILGILFIFDAISLSFDSKVYCDQSATTTDCRKPPPGQFATSSKLEPTTSLNPIQSGKIDEHLTIDNTLRDVNFCGKIYKTKQVLIDGVDVVQRIAEIITEMTVESQEKEQLVLAICENMKSGITTGNLKELEVSGPAIRNNDNSKYYLGVGRFLIFTINYPSLQIEVNKAEEGSSIVIGVLK